MGFANVHDYVQATLDGKSMSGHFRKLPGWATVANCWFDLSMAAGNPAANFYASAPLVAARLSRWDSIFHGDLKAPSEKYLTRALLVTSGANMAGQFILCDYVLYYPFVDMDSTDQQPFDNTVTLDRYTDGAGLQAIAISQAPTTGNGTFQFEYVNQDGATKTSPIQYCSTAAVGFANSVTSQVASVAGYGPFLNLDGNDSGIRRINSYTGLISNGGLCCIALVKPLLNLVIREANTPCEVEMLSMRSGAVRIQDNAFLGLIAQTAGSVSGVPLTGQLDFIWT